jgi:hypothetical protein
MPYHSPAFPTHSRASCRVDGVGLGVTVLPRCPVHTRLRDHHHA